MKNNYFTFDYSNTKFKIEDLLKSSDIVSDIHKKMLNRTSEGSDFLGWLDLPLNYPKDEFNRIKEAAKKIRRNSKVVVNIGIGGSYLGLKMAIDFLSTDFKNDVEMLYAGHTLSSTYLVNLVDYLKDKDFSLIVVSKSGTTTEPTIAFRVLEELLKEKYENYSDRIYCVTDEKKGALKQIADIEKYETFTIPDDVGGRFSVLTGVGLLGMASVGIDIDKVMEGAILAHKETSSDKIEENLAYQYAVLRNELHKEYPVEVLVGYEPNLVYFSEWWKQLFGESEGKNSLGIYPASVTFSTDLHSMGQFMQDGSKIFFETIINVKSPLKDIVIKENKENYDGLNYLAGKSLHYINEQAFKGTLEAHVQGNVPCTVLGIPDMSPMTLGYMVYFFEKACAMSAYILGVNPFDQPGVELYKQLMFKLLGKI